MGELSKFMLQDLFDNPLSYTVGPTEGLGAILNVYSVLQYLLLRLRRDVVALR